jgi:hypothetical protein
MTPHGPRTLPAGYKEGLSLLAMLVSWVVAGVLAFLFGVKLAMRRWWWER